MIVVDRIFYAGVGLLVGLSVPFNWLLWRAYSARQAWWDSWLKTEFARNGSTYVVLALVFGLVFTLIGYFLGQKNDNLREESRATKDHNLELSELANTDGLTGLLNARAIHERLSLELENNFRVPLSCLLIDIDHFKRINDTFGHPYGDEVLVKVAQIVRKSVRNLDPVGRLGGEEFLVVLPSAQLQRASELAEKIREAVQLEGFTHENKRLNVTVSIGVSSASADVRDKESLLKSADAMLYKAKRSGRNRVES